MKRDLSNPGATSLTARASQQWATRPPEERFTSLTDLYTHTQAVRERSRSAVMDVSKLEFRPDPADELRGLLVNDAALTHWSFGQACKLCRPDGESAPTSFLRTLPAPMTADVLNYGIRKSREQVGILATQSESLQDTTLRALTGPKYGRIWNAEIVAALTERCGDGITGRFRVPSEFGQTDGFTVTRENTTLYASDRDFFVFLADEQNRIEVPNTRSNDMARHGKRGLARGFMLWNSEVGDCSLGLTLFLFDFACANRTIWGLGESAEIRLAHRSGAPGRWLDEILPAVRSYSDAATDNVTRIIEAAQQKRLTGAKQSPEDRDADVADFLAKRFTKTQSAAMMTAHLADEGRPIQTLWDAANAATGYARGIQFQDQRTEIEREAGRILQLAA